MTIIRKLAAASFVTMTLSGAASADLMRDLKRLKGYTIVHVGTVTGYIAKDGKKENDFEGCDFGRVLIVDYSYQITCTSYSYRYAFNPDVIILTNENGGAKAIIDGEMFDVSL